MAYRIERQSSGQWAILSGETVVRDNFASNAAAWRALDRLEGDAVSPSEARASWGFRRAAIDTPYAHPVPINEKSENKVAGRAGRGRRSTKSKKRQPMATRSNKLKRIA